MKSALFFPIDAVLAAADTYMKPASGELAPLSLEEFKTCPLLTATLVRHLARGGCNLENAHLLIPFGNSALDVRTYHVLWRSRIYSLAGLVAMTPNALFSLRNFGPVSYANVIESLRPYLAPWWDDIVAIDTYELAHPNATIKASNLSALLDRWEIEWRHLPASQAMHDACAQAGVDVNMLGDVPRALERAQAGFSALLPAREVRTVMRDVTQIATEELASLLVAKVASLPDDTRDTKQTPAEPITIAALLDILAARYRGDAPTPAKTRALDVLFDRAGVYDGQPKTLNELGGQLGLTRERVRQLIARAEERLREPDLLPLVWGLGLPVSSALEALGGVARVSDVAEGVSRLLPFGVVDPVCATQLLASWSGVLHPIAGDRLALNRYSDALIERAEAAIAAMLKAHPDRLPFDEFVARAQLAGGDGLREAGPAFVAALVRCTDHIAIIQGECRPAGRVSLRSRLVAALHAIGQPAHFTQLARTYRQMFPDEADRKDNSVHALLGRFRDDFVLVGHGIFALAEWGYDPALRDVASVVEDVLRQAEHPLHRDEVVRRVAERYRWKPNSVAAALATDDRIHPFGNAFFGLRDRTYAPFDPEATYAGIFGVPKTVRQAIVTSAQTNERGNQVLRLRLTASVLQGYLPLSNRQTRACFPDVGDVSALCCEPSGIMSEMMLHRGNTSVSGLGAWFAAIGACAGDELLVERLDDALPDEPRYLLVHAPPDRTMEALRLAGLRPNRPSDGAPAITEPLFYLSNLDAVRQLAWHALAHPWAEIGDAQAMLGFAHAGTQGSAYQRLGVRTGMLADGQVAGHRAGAFFRPTRAGRAWVAGAHNSDPDALQRALALRLPAYRWHLRAGVPGDGATAILSPLVITRWDRRFGLAPHAAATQAALDASAAFVLARDLRRPGLALLLLLLAAQSHGLGVALAATSLGGAAAGAEAIDSLRAQGLVLVVDTAGRAALDEQVSLGVDDARALEARLRGSTAPVGAVLADAWCAVEPICARAGAVNASELFIALQSGAPAMVWDALIAAPAALSDTAHAADSALFDCSFPWLVADGAWAHDQPGAPFAFWRDAMTHLGSPDDSLRAPLGVCLCDDLMRRSWDAPRHLGANAHLALLVALAGDLGGLAERIHHGDAGWELGGLPLVPGLDRALGALGYDVWNERYRDDPDARAELGETLVALGERLGLLRAEGRSLEAVGSLASDVYYGVYYADHDPLARVRNALALAAVS